VDLFQKYSHYEAQQPSNLLLFLHFISKCSTYRELKHNVAFQRLNRLVNQWVERKRVRIENVWARLEIQFRMLSDPYRGKLEDFANLPTVCANLLKIEILFRPLRRT